MSDEFTIDAKYKRDNVVAEHERYRHALETIRMGTNPGAESAAEAQDNPVLTRVVIHKIASEALVDRERGYPDAA